MKIALLLLLILGFQQSFAYVATRTEYDQNLHWDYDRSESLDIYVNPNPLGISSANLTSDNVKQIFNESISEWNKHSPYSLDVFYSDSLPGIGVGRTVRFTSDTSYFGSGVLAVTSVSHSAATGKIYAADILINDSYANPNTFTNDKSISGGYYAYLGDVLTHELGHFFGLGHSEVFGSTMVFSVFKGQHTLHQDDISGTDYLYNNVNTGGSISGSVITGNGIAVFGAQVQAISYKTGKAAAGVMSEADGTFTIKELPTDDSYLIYVLPPRQISSLPTYYQSIKTKYCSGNSFVPSFFAKCGGSNKGEPQVIEVASQTNIDIGSVSIRCDEGMNPNYLYSKVKEEDYTVQEITRYNLSNSLGATHIGYFSDTEISKELAGTGDHLVLDLRDFEVPLDSSYYLNIKVTTKELGSAVGLYANIYDADDNLVMSKDMSYGEFAQRETDLEFDLALSNDQNENIFRVELFPRELSSTESNELFGNTSVMTNKNATYLLLSSIKFYNNGKYQTYALKDSFPYEDNYYCSEGEATVTARPNVLTSETQTIGSDGQDSTQNNAMSCGTIDIDQGNGPSGGLFSFSLGILLVALITFARRKSIDISLSNL